LPKVFIESFSYISVGEVGYKVSDASKERTSSQVSDYYIKKKEITNGEYLEFLKELKVKDTLLYKKHLPDTLGWRRDLEYDEVFTDNYLRHPAFSNHPLVNITKENAMAYCQWQSERYHDVEGYSYEFRLPTRAEWINATNKGETYNWTGLIGVKNKQGRYLANFHEVNNSEIHFNRETNQHEFIGTEPYIITNWAGSNWRSFKRYAPVEVEFYGPYTNDLYNMNGNVAEMVLDQDIAVGGSWKSTGYDIRNESYFSFIGSSIEVGFRPIVIVTPKE